MGCFLNRLNCLLATVFFYSKQQQSLGQFIVGDGTHLDAAIPFLPKQCFSLLIGESQVPAAVEAIQKANRTGKGEHGDGKVFVLDVSDAVRISTDERGPAAV